MLPGWLAFAAPFIARFFPEDRVILNVPETRMYCVVSQEALALMVGESGKLCAQTAHGYVHALWDAERRHWLRAIRYKFGPAAVKITLVTPTNEELERLADHYRPICGVSVVTDAGRTVFNGPTMTCVGIGPLSKDEARAVIGRLKSLKKVV